MKNCTDKFKETNEEKARRVDAMLKSMVTESAIYSYVFDEPLPRFTRKQIADYCGCSPDYIERIERSAIRKITPDRAKL